MSLPVSEELLSAYLDGELSPSEHELVERLLGELPALREQLAELSQVGERLRALRREPAPETLHREVMAAVASRSVQKSDSPARPIMARDVAKAAGALAACLAVGISVWLANHSADESASNLATESLAVNDSTDSQVETDKYEMAASPKPMMAVAEGLNSNSNFNGLAAPAPAASPRGRAQMDAPLAAAAPAMEMGAIGIAGKKTVLAEEAIRDRLLAPGYVPSAGELLSYLDVVDDQPVVVEYAVADVQRALGQVQVLLSRNGIRAVGASQAPVQVEGDGTVAIYLEANEQELAGVLDGLRSLPLVMVVDEAESQDSRPQLRRQSLQARSINGAAMRQEVAADRKHMEDTVARPPAPPLAEPVNGPAAFGGAIQLGLKDVEKSAGEGSATSMLHPESRGAAGGEKAKEKSESLRQSSFQLALPQAAELQSVLNSRRDVARNREQQQQSAHGKQSAQQQQSTPGKLSNRAVADADGLSEAAEREAVAGRRRVVIFLQSDVPAASPAVETSPTPEKQ